MSAQPDLHLLARGIRSLRGPLDLDATARRAVDVVVSAIPLLDGAALTWLASATDAEPRVLSAAGEDVPADELTGPQGATLTSIREGRSIRRVVDGRDVVALPLAVENRSRGALTVTAPDRLVGAPVEVADVLSAAIAVAVDAAHTETTLSQALETRGTIGQAQGLLMERYDIDETRAFEVLRRVSQHRNVKLNLIASETVRTRTTPGLQDSVDEVGRS